MNATSSRHRGGEAPVQPLKPSGATGPNITAHAPRVGLDGTEAGSRMHRSADCDLPKEKRDSRSEATRMARMGLHGFARRGW